MAMRLKQYSTDTCQLHLPTAAEYDLCDFVLLVLPQKLGCHLDDLW